MAEFDREMNCPLKRLEYNEKLKNSISSIFYHYVNPMDFVPLAQKFDILNRPDAEYVCALTANEGVWKGATVLLEKLTKYDNWFQCILDVLRDETMNKDHVAKEMLSLKGELDEHFFKTQVDKPQEIDGSSPSGLPPSHSCPPPPDVKPENDFNLSDEESTLSVDGALKTDSAKPPPNKMKLPRESKMHGPEYDFTAEEVKSVLGRMRGWQDITREEEVWNKLTPLRRENGHYLLCFLSERKRPAIFVTQDNQIKLFLIHKKPFVDHRKQIAYYFIYKSQKKKTTMGDLVNYHIKNGLVESSNSGKSPLVRFIEAVEP